MMTLKKKRSYEDPLTTVMQADLEGLICASIDYIEVQADELHNMNADESVEEPLYLEF